MLQNIYNIDGTRKSFTELLEEEQRLSKTTTHHIDLEKILHDFYITDIRKGVLNNLTNLNTEQKFLLFDKIFNLTFEEIDYLGNSIDVLFKKSVDAFEIANQDRVRKVGYLLNYIIQNQNTIKELIEIDLKEGNKHSLWIRADYLQKKYDSLVRKINKNETIKNTSIYNELEALGGMGYGK